MKNLTQLATPLLEKEHSFEASLETLAVLISDKQVRRNQESFFPVLLLIVVGPIRDRLLALLHVADFDAALSICRFLSEFGDAFVEQIVKCMDDSNVRVFLELMLACTSAPGQVPVDQELGEASLYFWFNLEETLNEVDHTKDDFIVGIFKRALHHILESLRLPSESLWESWPKDTKERYRSYRSDCFDTVQYCSLILEHDTFGDIVSPLWTFIAVKDYDGMEANLFALTSLAEYWRTEWFDMLKQVLTVILPVVLGSQHSRLAKTTLRVLEAFSCRINALGSQSLGHGLDFILHTLFSFSPPDICRIGLKALSILLQGGTLTQELACSTSEAILKLSQQVNVSSLIRSSYN